MAGRKRLKRVNARGIARFLDNTERGKKGKFRLCRICMQAEAFDALYEFARAKEVLMTTEISYGQFWSEWLVPVLGRHIHMRYVTKCLSDHIRPALRREMFIYELEEGRRAGHVPSERDIDDFCLGRAPRPDLMTGTSRPTGGELVSPETLVDPASDEEVEIYDLKGIQSCVEGGPEEDGVTHYKLVYWRRALDAEKITPENDGDSA